jgi:YXWGXW repeat-containing protein
MRKSIAVRTLLFALLLLAVSGTASAGIILSIGIAPPPLPVYDQPLCPAEGYMWTPGYWAYADEGYFWVPGTWVLIPEPGYLWTPGYWGWGDGLFVFHTGYWGPHIGFYGGVNYGFGYGGVGYAGGYWNNGAFFYNRSVNNVTNITNVYNKTVIVNNTERVSYNGGSGGIEARPTAEEEAASRDRHIPPTSTQTSHVQTASSNRQLYESVNHGKPAIAATAKPGEFTGHGAVAAKAAAPSYKPATARSAAPARGANPAAENRTTERPATAVHPKDLPPRPASPSAGNASSNQKYQQQQQKLNARQDQERQKLQQSQEKEHQQLAQKKAPEAAKQQVEQKHQQQTQNLQQKHTQQQQQLQKQAPRNEPKPKEK